MTINNELIVNFVVLETSYGERGVEVFTYHRVYASEF